MRSDDNKNESLPPDEIGDASRDPENQLPVVVKPASLPEAPRSHDLQPCAKDPFVELMCAELPAGYVFHDSSGLIMLEKPDDKLIPICGPLRVSAIMSSLGGDSWSVEVRFLDRDGLEHAQVCTMIDLTGSPRNVAVRLSHHGLDVRGSAAQVADLIKTWHTESRRLAVGQPGWILDGQNAREGYVLADGTAMMRPKANLPTAVLLGSKKDPIDRSGSLAGWQTGVAALAQGNPALIFAIAAGLAGPLLRITGTESTGFNFYGRTSSGKSHALAVALGLWGDPQALPRWEATTTGLELLCRSSNDGLLALDEFPSSAAKAQQEAVYMIGNGTGRVRGGRDMQLQTTAHWRTVLLSTSEKPILRILSGTTTEAPAGLGVRLIDIPAVSWRHALFAELHGDQDGQSFSGRLKSATERDFGHAGPAFVKWLSTKNPELFDTVVNELQKRIHNRALKRIGFDRASAPGELHRCLERFALVATAGEIAIQAKVLPWPPHTVESAVMEIIERWNDNRPRSSAEIEVEVRREVSTFIVDNLERFLDLGSDVPGEPDGVAGWIDAKWIYVDGEVFGNEVCGLHHPPIVAKLLLDGGLLKPGGEARSLQYKMPRTKVPARPRVYRLRRDAFLSPEGTETVGID